MKKLTMAIGLSIAAMSAAVGAYAAQGPGKGYGTKADSNDDGIVTRAEMQAQTDARFAMMDVNKDGKVDQADRDAMRADRQAKHFAMLDKDGNGQISKQEFDAAHASMGMREDMGKRGGGDGHWGRGHGHGGRGGGMMLRMADANGDGTITKAEMDAAAAKHFDAMDADKDGKITVAERQAAHEKLRAQWRANRGQAAPTS